MAGKVSWLANPSNADTTAFRHWGKEFSDNLATVLGAGSMVRTADTGQIDWATVSRPGGTSTYAGYEMYRFDDPAQATAPVFLKIEYGNDAALTRPSMRFSVGDGTNGTGTIVGALVLPLMFQAFNVTPSDYIAFPSYVCVQPGYVGIAWACGAVSTKPGAMLVVERPCDDDGVLVDEGVVVRGLSFGALANHQMLRYAQPKLSYNGMHYCLVPSTRDTSQVGNEIQVYRHFCAPTPIVRNLIGSCTHMRYEIIEGTEFNTALMNGESHGYVALGAWAISASSSLNANHCFAMRFEA